MDQKNFILDSKEKRDYVKCALCGMDDYRCIFVNHQDKFMKRLNIQGSSNLVMCNKCRLVYHNPRIKEEIMRELYLTYEYPTRSQNVQVARQRDAQERFEWLREIMDEVKSVLEIGCAEGFILNLFKSCGKHVMGVDPSDKYARIGRENGIFIHTGFFDENSSPEAFDIIISCNTFEHMYHPLQILREIRRRTKKYLFLECPNVFKPRDNLKYNYFNTTHVYMYSLNTMRMILLLSGFEVVKIDDSGFGIRVLAKKGEGTVDVSLYQNDCYWQLRRRIFLHQLRWYVAAEWKDWLRKRLKC